jgi:RNA polymerase sigma-54 factor
MLQDIVKSLNPRPGNIISDILHHEHITPDIIIVKRDSKWVVELNPSINPKIRINKAYKELMEKIKSKSDQEYVKNNLQDANFFLKALIIEISLYSKQQEQYFINKKIFLIKVKLQ